MRNRDVKNARPLRYSGVLRVRGWVCSTAKQGLAKCFVDYKSSGARVIRARKAEREEQRTLATLRLNYGDFLLSTASSVSPSSPNLCDFRLWLFGKDVLGSITVSFSLHSRLAAAVAAAAAAAVAVAVVGRGDPTDALLFTCDFL